MQDRLRTRRGILQQGKLNHDLTNYVTDCREANCRYEYPHLCNLPCLEPNPPRPIYLERSKLRQEDERAAERVLWKACVFYYRPSLGYGPERSTKPDYYFFTGKWYALELKDRKTASVQKSVEFRRAFLKKTPYPLIIFGSYKLNDAAMGIAKRRKKLTLARTDFRYADDPKRWESLLLQYVKKLLPENLA